MRGKYFIIKYDEFQDKFSIWLCNGDPEKDDEWGFCLGCSCVKRETDTDNELIHYSMLTKVRDLLKQGWKYYN